MLKIAAKATLVLFVLVAMIPASLLAANSAYAVFKLQEQISNLYHGILVVIVDLDDGHLSLLQMKSDILSHILTTDKGQTQVLEERIRQNERRFSDVLANYKEISDFPLQVEIMKKRGLENMTSSDHEFISQVRADWVQYQESRDKLLSLSGQNRNSEAAAIAFGEANTRFDKLIASYQKTVDLNKEIARVLYEESNDVAWLAYLYSALAFAISLGIAVVVAMMLSKRMTSPIAAAQRQARMDMDKFAAEASITESYRHNNPSAASRSGSNGLAEGATDANVLSKTATSTRTKSTGSRKIGVDDPTTLQIEELRAINEILSNNQTILLHAELYNSDSSSSFSSMFLDSLISSAAENRDSTNHDDDDPYAVTANAASSETSKRKLVLITRAGSNLYREVYQRRRRHVEVYLLSISTMMPITKTTEGLVVISSTNTTLIAEAIRRSLQEDPSSIVIFDNITGLVNTAGFEKTHTFINALFEIAQPFENSRIVFLVNKKAHLPNELQSIANMFNVFI
jgi:hypothetical protein